MLPATFGHWVVKTAGTYHSHAKIRDKWNAENQRERIDMDKSDSGRGVVKQGIRAAEKYLKDHGVDAVTALAKLKDDSK
ncbi:MAG: hypothetical protein H6822_19640 [Planctomycetaceae bacterium]|nr:hypothetical protein [Planctomycetales bacterium]MCB9924401.1 hypothetical protein [Planctomycetaceae bacterium]